jgi:hypothetical protein
LKNLSDIGFGLFAHIPDHSMCNSVFINFLANCLSTAINKIEVQILDQNSQGISCLSHNLINNKEIRVGSLQSDQQQNIMLKVKIKDKNSVNIPLKIKFDGKELDYSVLHLDQQYNLNINFNEHLSNQQLKHLFASSSSEFAFQVNKCWMIKILQDAIRSCNLKRAMQQLDLLYENIENLLSLLDDHQEMNSKLTSLLRDIKSGESNEGQLYKAIEKDSWFKRWGVHYLKYFTRSHQLQNVSNFKDYSLQFYASSLFKMNKSKIEDIFSQIPVPKPTKNKIEREDNPVNFEKFQKTFYSVRGGKKKKVFFSNKN